LSARRFVGASVLALTACASGGTPAVDPDAVTAVRALPPDTAASTDIPGMPRGFGAEFVAADARARRILYHQQCAAAVPSLRARGKFGAAGSAPRGVYCARTADGIPLGGAYDIDSALTTVRRLTVIRLDGAQARWTQPLDTTRIVSAARAARELSRSLTPQRRGKNRPFVVVPVIADSGTPEAWAMPLIARGGRTLVTGGDVGATASSPIADRTATWKTMTVPGTGMVTIRSAEPSVAAVQDLLMARMLAERGREVTVVTATATSSLVPGQDASGSRYTWQHAPTPK
jgi:hypothetical protein